MEATPEQLADIPQALKTFEVWMAKSCSKNRQHMASAKEQVEILRDLFCSEALPPAQVATSRFRSLVKAHPKQELSVRNFAEFWSQHEGPLLNPNHGTVSFGRPASAGGVPPLYRTCSLEEAVARAARRRQVYAPGRVPLEWTVEVPTATGPLKIRDDEGKCYATEEEAAQAYQKQREQHKQDNRAEDTGRKRSSGWKKVATGEAISTSKEEGGRHMDSVRDLVLRRHEWQVVGLRGTGGGVVPLDSQEASRLRPEEVSVVLRMDIKETKRQLESQLRVEWKLPEEFKIMVNPRLGGNLVIVTDAKGRTFMSKYQLEMREKLESEQQRRQQVTLKLPEVVQTLDRLGDAEVVELRGCQAGSRAARVQGFYCEQQQQQARLDDKGPQRLRKLLGLNLAADEMAASMRFVGAKDAGGNGEARWVLSP